MPNVTLYEYLIKKMCDILICTETLLFNIKTLCNEPEKNKIIPQSKFVKLSIKQEFKRYLL